jgi:response regulator RpfG family c-di-GMP phosphodiesterase
VSLRRALEAVPDDRMTRAVVDGVVRYLNEHRVIHVDAPRIASTTHLDLPTVQRVLDALVVGGVLDFVSDPPGYRLLDDRVLQIEIDLFLRSSRNHGDVLQSNVDRYRRMYGGR